MLHKQIDLRDRIAELEANVDRVEEEKEKLLAEAADYKRTLEKLSRSDDEYREVKRAYAEVEREWSRVSGELAELRGETRALKRAVENYEGSVFEIREFTYDDWNMLQDRITEASFDFDPQTETVEGHPKEGAFKSMVVNEALVTVPPEAPEQAGAMERQVCDYIYECVNALNTTGETDMGNSSLEEELSNYTS